MIFGLPPMLARMEKDRHPFDVATGHFVAAGRAAVDSLSGWSWFSRNDPDWSTFGVWLNSVATKVGSFESSEPSSSEPPEACTGSKEDG